MGRILNITLASLVTLQVSCGSSNKENESNSATLSEATTAQDAKDNDTSTLSTADQLNAEATAPRELVNASAIKSLKAEILNHKNQKLIFLQRDKKDAAVVKVIMPDLDFDSAEAQITKDGKASGGRIEITAKRKQQQALTLQRAANNTVTLFLSKKGTLIAKAVTAQIAVGDIFLIAGQSNSTNSGAGKTRSTSGGGFMFNGHDWAQAIDPMPLADGTPGSSSWPSFADQYYTHTGTPVGIVSLGYGATIVSWWAPQYWLYKRLAQYAKKFGKKGFRAVLWHQGESDVTYATKSWDYRAALQKIISQLRTDLKWNDLPFVVANTSYIGERLWSQLCDNLGGYPTCVNKIKTMQNDVLYGQTSTVQYTYAVFRGPNSDALWERKYRSYQDGYYIHLNVAGHTRMGKLWYDKVKLLPHIK